MWSAHAATQERVPLCFLKLSILLNPVPLQASFQITSHPRASHLQQNKSSLFPCPVNIPDMLFRCQTSQSHCPPQHQTQWRRAGQPEPEPPATVSKGACFILGTLGGNSPIARNIKLKENSQEKDSALAMHRGTEDQPYI